MRIYPDCHFITKEVGVGGLTKLQLIQKLKQQSVRMNEYANVLLSNDKFTPSDTKYSLKIVELTVRNLGFPAGATISQLFKRAIELDLELCPLELGTYLRLEYLNQPEVYVEKFSQPYQAPPGSITIASEILINDDYFPKGFYLKNSNGVLWLRGYIADDLHVWNADDCFAFCQTTNFKQ